jgi:subtilase family serine protease
MITFMFLLLLAQEDRIGGSIDSSHAVAIPGNVHMNARPEFDEGLVDPSMKLNYVTLTLKLSESQQKELDQLLRDQQDSSSPLFRKWLTPEEYADRFGTSRADLAKISSWMKSEGFDIISTARGRRWISFNATAQQIKNALHTEIHHYRVEGELHFANATAPTVPAAIAPFAIGFTGLDDFKLKPTPQTVKPELNYNGQNVIAPGDLWIMYDILPLFSDAIGVTGGGIPLAVVGQSDVSLSDIASYRNDFNLPTNPPVKMLVPGATNPGIVAGDAGESDLDLEMTGAVAPNARIIFVYSGNVTNSVRYAIDQAIAPVVSYSYAGCEANQSSSVIASLEPLAQQANAQGITWIAGQRSGSNGCGRDDARRRFRHYFLVADERTILRKFGAVVHSRNRVERFDLIAHCSERRRNEHRLSEASVAKRARSSGRLRAICAGRGAGRLRQSRRLFHV